jgi:hypothetical protein
VRRGGVGPGPGRRAGADRDARGEARATRRPRLRRGRAPPR